MRKIALAIAVAMVVIGGVAAYARSTQGQPGNGPSPQDRFGVQGAHHRVDRDLGPVDGRDLIVVDVVVGTDRIAVRYTASGIQPVQFEHINDNPVFAREGPTFITADADGKPLTRYDGTESSVVGSSAIQGEIVFLWQGGQLHRLNISIARIMGDGHAHWTATFDF
jgi:hypothetical protein